MSGWKVVGHSEVLAVHAALLPTADIVYFSGSEYNPDQHNAMAIDHTRLYDCATGRIRRMESPNTDLFCCGHAFLDNGCLLVAGGTEDYPLPTGFHHHHWPGSRDVWLLDCYGEKWVRRSPLREAPPHRSLGGPGGGRWYPTLLTLPDGSVLAMSGHPSHTDQRHTNNTPEVYVREKDQWTLLAELGAEGFAGQTPNDPIISIQYPRLHALPGGDVFCVTPLDDSKRSRRYNPATQEWTYVGQPFTDDAYLAQALTYGLNTTSVLLPLLASQGYAARVLLCGSHQPLRIDPDAPTPTWTPTGPRQLAGSPRRYNLNAVLLPTGDVFVSGGISEASLKDTSSVRTAELYHPDTDQWESLEAAEVVRNYHSVALLLPDGRVWTAGSNHDHEHSSISRDTRELRVELYEPWYVGLARPQITLSPSHATYGELFDVLTPQAAHIRRVALIRAGSSTHAFDSDQRYVEVAMSHEREDHLLVTAPGNSSVAPPGPYLLFLIDVNGVPSEGRFIQLSQGAFAQVPGLAVAHQTGSAVCPAPGIVDVFWIRPDGMVFTNGRHPDINGGRWNNPINAVAPNPGSAAIRNV